MEILRRRLNGVVCTCVFLICAVSQVVVAEECPWGRGEVTDLRLISINIKQFPDGLGSDHGEERANKLIKVLRKKEQEADVVAVQELWDDFRREALYSKIEARYPFKVQGDERRFLLGFHSGLAIFSKYPIKRRFFHGYTINRGPENFANKGVLGVELDVCGKRVFVANTHMQAGDGGKFFEWMDRDKPPTNIISGMQLKEARDEIAKFMGKVVAPSFLIGDYNITALTEEYYRGLEMLRDARDTFDPAQSQYVGTVWDHFPSNNRIDYIMTLGMDVKGYSKVVDWFGPDITDHLGVAGVFEL